MVSGAKFMAWIRDICCLKRKSLHINFLFIELLYKISITFVIMLTFGEKNVTLHVIVTI